MKKIKKVTTMLLAISLICVFSPPESYAATILKLRPNGYVKAGFVRNNSVSTTNAVTITAPQYGDMLVLYAMSTTAGDTVTSISQTNVTWTRAGNSNTQVAAEIWYGIVATKAPGTTVTANWTTGTNVLTIVSEFKNVRSIIDGTAALANGSGTTATSGTYTNTYPYDLVLAVVGSGKATTPTDPPAGWSSAGATSAGSGQSIRGIEGAYKLVTSKAGQSASWTTGNGGWDTVVIGLKAIPGTSVRGKIKVR